MSVLAKNVQRREVFLEAHAPKALESVARVRSSPRAKTISEQTRFYERCVYFEIAALFSSLQGKRKIIISLTETSPFLHCLSSNTFVCLLHNFARCIEIRNTGAFPR